jgi:hypothetical protein
MPVCAFCARTFEGRTKDHIPPRGLFGDKPTGQLITVPACVSCNNGTTADDEYFRLIALDHAVSDNAAAQEVTSATIRAFWHPKKEGFKKSIMRNLRPVELTSPAGLFLGNTFAMKIKLPRLLCTVEKTIRGLFYHIRGYPVPPGYEVFCSATYMLEKAMPDPATNPVHQVILPWMSREPIHEIGPEGVFRYRYVFHEDGPDTIFFMLGFYGMFDFFGFTKQIGDADEEDEVETANNVVQ